VTSKREWSVKQLAACAEGRIKDAFGLAVATALVLCPTRDTAAPFYEPAADFFGHEDCVELVGDVSRVHATSEGTPNAKAGGVRASQKVPVTILTGFLGAGKTTMLNHLLHVQREKRIAVIENEFGEVPIDGDLLADGDGLSAAEQVVVLDNGCMCCTVRGDLLGAFASVLRKMHEGDATNGGKTEGEGDDSNRSGGRRMLDSVLVETTGMADPVPIVRTLLQTPAIAEAFSLDGVVTLVDAKNVLPRLRDGEMEMSLEKEQGGNEAADTVDEAFQQIMFSDRIVVNKVDLVSASTAVEVYERVRSINQSAGIVSCSRGKLDPAELEGLGAFDRLLRESEDVPEIEAEDGGHAHDHAHSHGRGDNGNANAEGAGAIGLHSSMSINTWLGRAAGNTHDGEQEQDHKDIGGCTLNHDHTGHDHSSRHSSQASRVGTFSLVKPSTEVLALPFARWVRSLAFLPKEKGTLFRSKAVLAVAGSDRKLVFHAVSDVMERREAGRWGTGEDRSCRIVFIGKRLDKAFLEEGFNATSRCVICLVVLRSSARRDLPRPPPPPPRDLELLKIPKRAVTPFAVPEAIAEGAAAESLLERLTSRASIAFFGAMRHLGTGDVMTVAACCSKLSAALDGGDAIEHYRALAADDEPRVTRNGFHLALRRAASPKFYLHHMVSAATARNYAKAAAGAKLEMIPSMGVGQTGIAFTSAAEVEAAGITWLEVEQLADPLAKNFVVEFCWRTETMATFFADPDSSTSSAMVKIEYEVNKSTAVEIYY
ncbi:unnamed protein product, partial [Sphacelaria rigidula]